MSALPPWVRLQRADNPGPMTLEGTNTWVLGEPSRSQLIVVDPGPDDDAHLRAIADHGEVGVILLTHGHRDHSEGIDRLHQMTKAPVLAFDARWLRGAEPIADDDAIALGDLDVTVLHTPGHSSDSLTFIARHDNITVVLTGDTILGRGSTIVEHPDGRLADYLGSLDRIHGWGDALVLPGHGPTGATAQQRAAELRAHRRERLFEVERAWNSGLRTIAEITAAVYVDAPADVRWAAEVNVEAQLTHLSDTGRI